MRATVVPHHRSSSGSDAVAPEDADASRFDAFLVSYARSVGGLKGEPSQSLGYSVAGGDTYGADRLESVTIGGDDTSSALLSSPAPGR